ncbi:unnamed protein product [Symbiodinium microadriaticum]|nr:unnamed protein product [Symbiodinium microadriaticum]
MTSNSPSTEQRTPSTWLIYDEFASVGNVSFVDLDLDETQLGGTIEWDPPVRTAAVSVPSSAVQKQLAQEGTVAYLIYLAQDGTGAFKSQCLANSWRGFRLPRYREYLSLCSAIQSLAGAP